MGAQQTIGDVVYNLDESTHTAQVGDNRSYSESSLTIPGTVEYDSKTYTVTTIGSRAFSGCSGLTSITIPASVTSIGIYAFYGTGLTSVTFEGESQLKIIDEGVFYYCINLTSITIPASVTTIGKYAFMSSFYLKSITFGEGSKLETIAESAFCECERLEAITIPVGVTSIGNYAFNNCASLKAITIPAGVTSIGNYAFYGCTNPSFTSVTIPASVTSIGESAFEGCSKLATVILNSNPSIGSNAFSGTNNNNSATVKMNLTGGAGATGEYWMTFYNQNYNFQVPSSTQIFKAALTGSTLELIKLTTDKIVNAGNAVILKSTTGPIELTLASAAGGNDFTIADGKTGLTGVSNAAGKDADGSTYVLNKGNQGVGFYKLASGKKVGVGKAYLVGPASAREFFGFDEATAIESVTPTIFEGEGACYDLQGRRVAQPTKGLYIVNGKKVVIK